MDNLNLKERMCIEMKYLGHSYPDIAEGTGVPLDTIKGWFATGGKLHLLSEQYTVEMNTKRQKQIDERISVSDEEFFVITTNVVRRVGKTAQEGRKVPLVDKETGNALADKNGNPIMVTIPPNYDMDDLLKAWKIQRIMKGLPTEHQKTDFTNKTQEADEIIKALGLTDEDFEDDKLEHTTKKIRDYIASL